MSGINKSQRAAFEQEAVSIDDAAPEAGAVAAVPARANLVSTYDGTAQLWQQSVDVDAQEAAAAAHAQEEAARSALCGVKNAIDAFAAKPNSRFNVTDTQVGFDAGASERLKEGAEALPREAIEREVERQIKANPSVKETDVHGLTAQVMRHLDAAVAVDLTQKMKHEVTGLMSKGAREFEAAADDPKMLERIADGLAKKEGRGATASDRQEAARYRELVGLSETAPLTPANLKAAFENSAALLQREQTKFEGHEENTIYRALLMHDVGGLLISKGEVSEGSWAAGIVEQVHARGEDEEKKIAIVKGACAVALSVTTGGLGGPLLAAGTVAAFNAPGVGAAFHKVGEGRAGALSGSAARDADLAAKHEAQHALVEAGASTAASAAMPALLHKAGHSLGAVKKALFVSKHTERVASEVGPTIAHKATEAAVEAGIGVTGFKTKGHPRPATGTNLLEYSAPKTTGQ